jgi:hypothetical protein
MFAVCNRNHQDFCSGSKFYPYFAEILDIRVHACYNRGCPLKVLTFWDSVTCSPRTNRRFGEKFTFIFRGRKSFDNETRMRPAGIEVLPSHLLARWFLYRQIFDPEDGGDISLRNIRPRMNNSALSQIRRGLSCLMFVLTANQRVSAADGVHRNVVIFETKTVSLNHTETDRIA